MVADIRRSSSSSCVAVREEGALIKAIVMLAFINMTVLLCDPVAGSAQQASQRYRAGLRNSDGDKRLNESQLRRLLDSLRHKSGFQQMEFDQSGFLILGDRAHVNGGSATARALLVAAVDGHQAFELEDYDHSPGIAFARITSGIVYNHFQTKLEIKVRQVQLDFSDFAELRGDREARVAFDPGFAVLHELVHGVLDLPDSAAGTTEIGACDEQINRVRRELNLPERQGYGAQSREVRYGMGGATREAELVFARSRAPQGRSGTKWFYLRWDRERVADAAKSSKSDLWSRN
jgi:hypothetical protein